MRALVATVAAALVMMSCTDAAESPATSEATITAPAEPAGEPDTPTPTARPTTTTAPAAPTTVQSIATTSATATAALEDFESLLARLEAAGEPTSSRMEGTQEFIGLWGPFGPENLTLRFSLARDGETGNASISMDAPAIGQGVSGGEDGPISTQDLVTTIEVREVGATLFVNMGSFDAPDGVDQWTSMPREEGAGIEALSAGLPVPTEVLAAYRGAEARVEEVGREPVNGLETTHYAITIDMEAFLAQMSEDERAELEDNSPRPTPVPTGTFTLDLWISDDGYLVRMLMEAGGYMVAFPDGGGSERMILTFDVFDIGGPISIEAPPASEVTPSG